MPGHCKEHQKLNRKCFECIIAELLSVHYADFSEINPQQFNKRLRSALKDMDEKKGLSKSQVSLFNSITMMLNSQILTNRETIESFPALKCTFELYSSKKNVPIELSGQNSTSDYKSYIKQAGNWGGYTELCSLSRLFNVEFGLEIEQTGRIQIIGEENEKPIENHRLFFSGDHYVVKNISENEKTITNIEGDCMFEAFLQLMLLGRIRNSGTESEKRILLHRAHGIWPDRDEPFQEGQALDTLMTDFRKYLADNMNEEEVTHAVIACGHNGPAPLEKGGTGKSLQISNDNVYGMMRISLLPTPKEWKRISSVKGVRRKNSNIIQIDRQLDSVWEIFDEVNTGDCKPEVIDELKDSVNDLKDGIDLYLQQKKFTKKEIQVFFDELPEKNQSKPEKNQSKPKKNKSNLESSGRKRLLEFHKNLTVRHRKNRRIVQLLSLRRIVKEEIERLEDWKQGSIPKVDSNTFWQGYTVIPPMKLWLLDSSGGKTKRKTPRKRSKITKIDNRLKEFWSAFRWADKENAIKSLGEIIDEAALYLEDKESKNARLRAVERLKVKAENEKQRLKKYWINLLPPRRILNISVISDRNTLGPVGEWMGLRTFIPSQKAWKKKSSASGKKRSLSGITSVDKTLDDFWNTFKPQKRGQALEALTTLNLNCDKYLLSKKEKNDSSNIKKKKRYKSAKWLKVLADEECNRLSKEWEENERLPPYIHDIDNPSISIDEVNEAQTDIQEIKSGIGKKSLEPFNQECIEGKEILTFDIIEPDKAKDILTGFSKKGSKSRKRLKKKIAAMSATGLHNYCDDIKKSSKKDRNQNRWDTCDEISVAVMSYADAMAQNIINNKGEANDFVTTSGLGEMSMALFGIARIISVVKRDGLKKTISKSGKGKLIFDSLSYSIHTGNAIEKVPSIIKSWGTGKGASEVTSPVDSKLSFLNTSGESVSVFDSGAMGLGIITNSYQLFESCKTYRGITNVLERFDALYQNHHDLAEVIDTSPAFRGLQLALAGKLGRRKTRTTLKGTQALVGIGSSSLGMASTITGGLAAANVWNPVGWTLIGLGALMSIGFLTHKGVRRKKQKNKLKDSKRAYDVPNFIKTQGEWERFQMADLMFRAAIHDPGLSQEMRNIGYALLFIILGGNLRECCSEARKMMPVGIMAFIKG